MIFFFCPGNTLLCRAGTNLTSTCMDVWHQCFEDLKGCGAVDKSLCLLQGGRNPAEKRWGWDCIGRGCLELALLWELSPELQNFCVKKKTKKRLKE